MTQAKIIKHWDSLSEALNAAYGPAGPLWGDAKRQSIFGDKEFTGTESIEQAVSLARHGWPDGLKNMARNVAALAAAPSLARGPAFSFDVGGAYPMAALASAGDPACMVNLAPTNERARPIIRLGVAASFSWRYETKEVENYGAGLVGIIDALEAADYRVEVNLAFSFQSEGEKALFTIKVKDSGDAIDLDRLAFCLCHASMLRRICFGLMESCLNSKRWAVAYGTPRALAQDEMPDFLPLAGVMTFKAGARELKSPKAAFEAMMPIISTQLTDRWADFPPLAFEGAA